MIMDGDKVAPIRYRITTENLQFFVVEIKQASYTNLRSQVILMLVQNLFVASGVVPKNLLPSPR